MVSSFIFFSTADYAFLDFEYHPHRPAPSLSSSLISTSRTLSLSHSLEYTHTYHTPVHPLHANAPPHTHNNAHPHPYTHTCGTSLSAASSRFHRCLVFQTCQSECLNRIWKRIARVILANQVTTVTKIIYNCCDSW